MIDASPPRIERIAEDALLLRVGDGIDPAINREVHRLAACLTAARLAGVREVFPAYASVLLRLDPATCLDPVGFDACIGQLHALLDASGAAPGNAIEDPGSVPAASVIPVCYGGAHGPDLDAVALHTGLSPTEVIARHSAADYQVAMLGFAPGFTYLLGLPEALQVPRRADPRLRVPPGSVAIGGIQTGIYPAQLPGGWNLIGRTPLRLFDPARESPCLLAPGQAVRFRAIDDEEFARLEAENP